MLYAGCVNYLYIFVRNNNKSVVNGGWCFSISQRKFVLHPVKDTDIGKESSKAYIEYDHNKTPDPGYFKEILQNRLNEMEKGTYANITFDSSTATLNNTRKRSCPS